MFVVGYYCVSDDAYLQPMPDPFKMKTPLGFQPPNEGQRAALKKALTQPFTLIQGPPGTGKTVTGAQLALMFSLANQTVPASKSNNWVAPQLIYCGPSNKSVDVVVGKFLLRYYTISVCDRHSSYKIHV